MEKIITSAKLKEIEKQVDDLVSSPHFIADFFSFITEKRNRGHLDSTSLLQLKLENYKMRRVLCMLRDSGAFNETGMFYQEILMALTR